MRVGTKTSELRPAKRRHPFDNDPELRRDLSRLNSTGSQLAGWQGSAEKEYSPFRRRVASLMINMGD